MKKNTKQQDKETGDHLVVVFVSRSIQMIVTLDPAAKVAITRLVPEPCI